MGANYPHKQIEQLISCLDEAERCGDAEAAQAAYEDLFTFCHKNKLNLDEVILRRQRDSTVKGTLRALRTTS
jgi:hypothetical protein